MSKKLFAGAVFAVAMVVAGSASAFTFDSKIDTLQEKKDVQTVLNMNGATLTVDGVFGAKTIAAVKAFQTLKGLTADGKIGPMTRAALTAASTGTTTGTTLPAGCVAGALFSSTTGAPCTTTSTPVVTGLTGGAGTISATETSTDVETYMVEGQSDVKVLGFKVTATDSDAKVTNLKVTLTQGVASGTPSTYVDRYVSDVAVWMNGTKVATIAAGDFTKDSSGVYSKSISLNNAVVKMGTSNKATFYVTISGVSNIDTADMGATWKVAVSDFRYVDATGVIMSYQPATIDNTLTVKDINTTGDVKLVITKDSTSPAAGNVKISDTSSTSDVPLLVFKAKNTGADMTFDTMKITVNSTTNPVAMIGELTLKANGSSVATWTPTSTSTGNQTAVFDLDDTYTLAKDTTTLFTVVAKINDIDNFVAGAITATYDSATVYEVKSTRTALTEEGAAAGETQTFYANGISASAFTYGTPVVVTNTSGTTTSATYSISFKVTASGNSYYVKKSGGLVATANGGATATFADLSATGATLDGSSFLVADGDTATFTTTGVIGSAASGFAKIPLATLSYGTTNAGTGSTYTFTPSTSFETSSTYFTD